MLEVFGNALDLIRTSNFDALCITTNGFVKSNGECVMGRGIALEIATRIPQLPSLLGARILRDGNHVHRFRTPTKTLYSFPVKHNWWETADIALIQRSCLELVALAPSTQRVLLPRPGCGNGHLDWNDVRPAIAPLLPDNIHIIHWK